MILMAMYVHMHTLSMKKLGFIFEAVHSIIYTLFTRLRFVNLNYGIIQV